MMEKAESRGYGGGACEWVPSLAGVPSTVLGLQKAPTHKHWGCSSLCGGAVKGEASHRGMRSFFGFGVR